MNIIPNSYRDLLESAAEFDNVEIPESEDLLRHLGFQGMSLQAQAPIFFVVDYTKKRYLYIDPSCKSVLGYELDFLANAGPAYFTGLWNKNDFKVFNENIFPEILYYLRKPNVSDYHNYSFSFNFRIKAKDGNYLTMLQRSTYFVDSTTGNPLAGVGFIIDITHFKSDTAIIFTIEKIDRNFSTLSKIPLLKKTYFPDKEYGLLSKREMEILHLMREGFSSKEIAAKLFISINTISNHRQNMLAKTNSKNSTELLGYAVKKGLFN